MPITAENSLSNGAQCIRCHTPVPSGVKFCPQCGYKQ
ncbi:MAG: zinc-ribbon domain-containing protein [Prevotellaceae bacterium]|nr:zinc-ribbon domain-containing protein [Prevotellaceae bacterium]